MSALLIGAGAHLRAAALQPEDNTPKDHHLRPPRLRRSSATHQAASSGQHSLSGVELLTRRCLPMSVRLIGADFQLRAKTLSPEENLPKRSSPPTTAAPPEFGLPTTNPPPASIRSQELGYPSQNRLPISAIFVGGRPPPFSKKNPDF